MKAVPAEMRERAVRRLVQRSIEEFAERCPGTTGRVLPGPPLEKDHVVIST